MTFSFFALHLSLGGKLDICGCNDPVFALHYIRPSWLGFKLRPPPPFQISGHAPECFTIIRTKIFLIILSQKIFSDDRFGCFKQRTLGYQLK